MNKCKNCKKNTKNPKFCSRSCSAKTTNKIPKRKKQISFCILCGKTTKFFRRRFCENCNPIKKDWSKITYGEIKTKKYQQNSIIRSNARKSYKKSGQPQCCIICGYKKHFEVCHIKAISSFRDTAKVSNINHISNLVALCPNHHWEFDHQHLSLPGQKNK